MRSTPGCVADSLYYTQEMAWHRLLSSSSRPLTRRLSSYQERLVEEETHAASVKNTWKRIKGRSIIPIPTFRGLTSESEPSRFHGEMVIRPCSIIPTPILDQMRAQRPLRPPKPSVRRWGDCGYSTSMKMLSRETRRDGDISKRCSAGKRNI
ncbi:hypothetical protein GBAR_LOCUS27061 [Geodia barretti]|uniref:Uncharacterized protein n=1 Tax=Geodia barretti TaxID=519541 RepID=A0AA35TKC1_GEOBA|nr:hypothetical protein GBAR_LOCUS27061 [Geodia barretti]